ncbi:MAG TPA: hypothetical protein VLD19_21810, partial [Chitinophagaceae bacterium]|nr:hypothetical protein [Chitinophagaceae bacterium]
MLRFLPLAVVALFCITLPALAAGDKGTNPGAEIIAGHHSTHIARITKDTIVVITGSTYSFTVDTPEDQGLVSTRPGIAQLVAELASKDGSVQQYKLTAKDGRVKTEGDVMTGDRLLVTAASGTATHTYHILVQPMALTGRLRLQQDSVTAGTKRDITLYFTAGQRSPDASVTIYLPAGIEVTPENTTVNVIGRGAVTLKELATQSIGRVGTHYSYSRVGAVEIKKSAAGTVLLFSHLDLRPANGADLTIVIGNA